MVTQSLEAYSVQVRQYIWIVNAVIFIYQIISSRSCSIDPFRHSDISVKSVNQRGGRVLIYIV